MTETVAVGPEPYGILQSKIAQQALANLEASALKPVTMMLGQLQTNPRPDGAEPDDQFGPGLTSLIIKDIVPPHYLIYRVDDDARRVVVMAIVPKWW